MLPFFLCEVEFSIIHACCVQIKFAMHQRFQVLSGGTDKNPGPTFVPTTFDDKSDGTSKNNFSVPFGNAQRFRNDKVDGANNPSKQLETKSLLSRSAGACYIV
jgi:hypothetical protein